MRNKTFAFVACAGLVALLPLEASACYKHTFEKCDGETAPMRVADSTPAAGSQNAAAATTETRSSGRPQASGADGWITTVRVAR